MSCFVRSSAMTASRLASRASGALPSTSLSALRPSRLAPVLASSPSSLSPLHLVPARTVVNDPKMPRPSASSPSSSPPSSLRPPRQSAPAQQVTNPKKTTWITGLDVVPNAREVLLSLYEETLRKAGEYDASHAYNAHVVQLCTYRRAVVQREQSVEAIEAAVNCGQIEDLIEQAENEYDLLVAMNETIKPWEADAEGDDAFADYHPSFGQQKSDFNLDPTADEQKAIDEQTGGASASGAAGGAAAAGAQQAATSGATAARA